MERFCCFRLRKGMYAIGALTIVLSLVSIAYAAFVIALILDLNKKITAESGVHIFNIVLYTTWTIAAILLMYGTSKRRHLLLIPWMVVALIILLFKLVIIVLGILAALADIARGAAIACYEILAALLIIYCLVAVRTFYHNKCYEPGERRKPQVRNEIYRPPEEQPLEMQQKHPPRNIEPVYQDP